MERFWAVFVLAAAIIAGCVETGAAQEPGAATDEAKDRPNWRAYYQEHARVRLGPEHRLPNGVAWRLHTDMVSGQAWPRITWMPDPQRARVANELFDVAHGGAVLAAMEIKWGREETRADLERRALEGNPNAASLALSWEFKDPVLVRQGDVLLTYASANLASVVDFGEAHTGGNHGALFFRAITFDLARREMHDLTKCAGSPLPYGIDSEGKPNLFFQFGPLLRICDRARYDAFKAVYTPYAKHTAQRALHDPVKWVRECAEYSLKEQLEDIGEQEILIYLTSTGLAVQRMSFATAPEVYKYGCPFRSAANPTIIPYRDLASLMEPGPWRDELLALR